MTDGPGCARRCEHDDGRRGGVERHSTVAAAKVSHWLRSPVLKPWRNQR